MKRWIAVDWGTTNFRAFLMQGNKCIERCAQGPGLLQIEQGSFEQELSRLLQPWFAQASYPIIMAGMVGSQQGWHEVPYVEAPCTFASLAEQAFSFTTRWASPVWIIPGVRCHSPYQQPDVMRGEEVQLAGLSAINGSARYQIILPGTHSKHVLIDNQSISHFSTYMTGELFALLSQHSILGRALPPQEYSLEVFHFAIELAQRKTPLSHQLFSARTYRLNKEIAEQHIHSYLSGLLIGAELVTCSTTQPIWCVGSPKLTENYAQAAKYLGINLQTIDGDECFIRGISHLYAHIAGEKP
ncbi:2-dehydro-3-deoxygalactonokinase [Jinshanibacter sp. LJY008]|uniref:2-dehydro-3-deoxygalactonokinase n=1 Tax=Limnobaculum eriocheiris TaxID=2897391 RepID=A0A9X1MW03_9GAMM|nr:2-dehydro-3-deoxygalactonokinase [Limnobaculum eriocheiris]MCD1125648.1 2-dehydro-3-deoxygalactonokinase [Limnobaculum eriocheiris]